MRIYQSQNAKIPNSPYGGGGGEVGAWHQLQTFDAELKMLKSQIPFTLGEGGTHFQLLMLSPKMLKSQIPFTVGGGGWREWGWEPTSNF